MGFSFNWAGTNINQINPQISRQAYEDAKNLGAAAAGARRMIGMQKYADLIRQASGGNASRIAEIQAEIGRLEARNKELGELQAQAQAQPQTQPRSYDEMRLHDEQMRNMRAGYMSPKGDPMQAGPYDGMYAPNTEELLKLIQTGNY